MSDTLTEAEAGLRWCPFGRVVARTSTGLPVHGAGVNRGKDGLGTSCLASGCMAWRWDRSQSAQAIPGGAVRDARGRQLGVSEPRGYCGLAGRPK